MIVTAKLVRLEESADGTFGALMLNGQAFCCTLEPPDRNNRRNISNIPPDLYVCRRVKSPKYGATFEVTGVPNRSHILFHSGNVVDHTKGCILLGRKWGVLGKKRAVLNSGDTFKAFMRFAWPTLSFNLTIVEA